ncbi:M28 family peptidase [Planomicrobium sp. CPCC 101110]|uniref:M28 family peptidase n=1 Tax=Planomicrobium sp. CPCC 101110 TaxID=2599619 RepID=UPI0011B6502D|nr:M28 family peptidase [Planomicrobium sp. CPCC 101110]TWT25350.1 M28 family peptidase [Planomicrobium sp. CPCC 101110]
MANVANTELEKSLLEEISTDVPVQILEKFSTLIRESGSEDERIAADFLTDYLKKWGVPHQVHNPELYLSVPKNSYLKVTAPFEKEYRVKSPSFSVITGDQAQTGELVYVSTGYAKGINDIFGTKAQGDLGDLTGKIILTEGYPMPGKVQEFADKGVAAIMFISPGKNIHEGICTTIWGAPDLDNKNNEPAIPVLAINKPDGNELIELSQKETVTLEFKTYLEQGWFNCPVIDMFIEGTEEPEKYVLLHGHLDSWHEGIGDNATGNAALLELARIFYKNRDKLKRSIRIAVWTGHSTGRYAGSTWFADQFGIDLENNCIASVNCDSPGCRWATSYEYMMWMSEVDGFCKDVVTSAVDQPSVGGRPLRAGDYSFNNIGITSFFMLSSSIPEDVLQEKGYYPVGGCGGNIEWHTEEDLMHVADLDILVKDIKVYLTGVLRAANATVHPFDFAGTADEFEKTIRSYQAAAGTHFDFTPALDEVAKLREELLSFNKRTAGLNSLDITEPEVKQANQVIEKLARILIPINFTKRGKFWHDSALNVPPLPDLAPALDFSQLEEGSHEFKVLKTHLTRGQNRVVWALQEARELLSY